VPRTAIRRRAGRAAIVAIAALMLPVLPASCVCAAATVGAAGHAGCHGNSEAPRAPAPEHCRDCGRCQVAIAAAPGQQTLSPPPVASRMVAAGVVLAAPVLPVGRAVRASHRATRPPARAVLLQKHVLLL
jgi:hypothetical protein